MIGLGSDKKSKWFCSSFSPSQHNNPCVIFRCFYLPVFSSFLLYQELQGHLPFFTRFLPDDIKTRWLPILSKKLSLLKSFIFHQQAVLGWPNLLAEQVSHIKSYIFFLPPFANCVFLRMRDECGEEGRLESNQGIHLLMFAGLLYNCLVFAGLLDVYLFVCSPFV